MISALPLCYAVLLLLSIAVICSHAQQQAVASPQACLDYGYNPATLICSTCDSVGQILGEQSEAKKKCLECCVNLVNSEEKYAKAVLEIDKRAVGFFPELKAIIDKKKELKLTVRYIFGSPRLLMYKTEDISDEEPAEELSVHSWNQDTFKDYLKSHLKAFDKTSTTTTSGNKKTEL